MPATCLVTPSYAADFERCRLLCDSIDRYVTGYASHYIIVDDKDVVLFQRLASNRRLIFPLSKFIPIWLNIGLKLRRNKWWARKVLTIYGWHVQQLIKLSVASRVAEPVSILLDSDVVFLRPWDIGGWVGERTPLFRAKEGIKPGKWQHELWLKTACDVLGLDSLPLPATDYISSVIAWDQQTVRSLLDRIRQNTGQDWVMALCQRPNFSEYLLYGCHVASDPVLASRHRWLESSPCHTYWGPDALDEASLQQIVNEIRPDQIALAVQSTSRTPAPLIRRVTGFD
jgi:hypothetical protein